MLVLPAELTHAQAGDCLRLLLQGLSAEQGACVQVDATALARFDSSAIAVLLECRRAALAQGKAFGVKALPRPLASLAELYGVSDLLPAS